MDHARRLPGGDVARRLRRTRRPGHLRRRYRRRSVASTYAYDPAADSWTPRADVPTDVWGMASAAANGQLLLSGGIAGGAVTNEGWVYDPGRRLVDRPPGGEHHTYRMGSGCGLYRIGGASGLFASLGRDAEVLPGFEDCGVATDVPWLGIDTTAATLAPGESVTVTVTMTGDVAQPGAYTAGVAIKENTPGRRRPGRR